MEISIKTSRKEEVIDITEKIQGAIRKQGKACLVYCPHTTAGILINEGYDESVMEDFLSALEKIVPNLSYKHTEDNSKAHIKAGLVGSSLLIPTENLKLALGKWQRIFFLEFDGPRERKIIVEII